SAVRRRHLRSSSVSAQGSERTTARILGRGGASPSGLKQLDRIARGIINDNLGATRPSHDSTRAEWHPGGAQPLSLRHEITGLNVNPVPAARPLTPTIRERPFAGAAVATQQQSHTVTRNCGKGR